MKTLLAAVALVALTGSAYAGGVAGTNETGMDLYNSCNAKGSDAADALACVQYLRGVWDGLVVSGDVSHKPVFCPTRALSALQMAAVYSDWAGQQSTSTLGHDSAYTATGAFVTKYPCKR